MTNNAPYNITFIINPNAGIKSHKKLESKILQYLDLDKYNCHFRYTEYKNHANTITEEIKDHNDVIVAVGGDGTVNEIAHALLRSDTLLAIIPRGSGNGLAREIGIPFKLKKSIAVINQQKSQFIDVGKVNNIYFFNSFSLGLSTDIAKSFDNYGKRGLWGYTMCTLKHIFNSRYIHLKIVKNDVVQSIKVKTFDVFNIAQFGYNFKFLPHVKINDGQLHLLSIKTLSWIKGVKILMQLGMGILPKYRNSYQESFDDMFVEHEETMAQIDGELIKIDKSPLHIECYPELLKVIVPR